MSIQQKETEPTHGYPDLPAPGNESSTLGLSPSFRLKEIGTCALGPNPSPGKVPSRTLCSLCDIRGGKVQKRRIPSAQGGCAGLCRNSAPRSWAHILPLSLAILRPRTRALTLCLAAPSAMRKVCFPLCIAWLPYAGGGGPSVLPGDSPTATCSYGEGFLSQPLGKQRPLEPLSARRESTRKNKHSWSLCTHIPGCSACQTGGSQMVPGARAGRHSPKPCFGAAGKDTSPLCKGILPLPFPGSEASRVRLLASLPKGTSSQQALRLQS